MPQRAKRPCRSANCPNLCDNGYCDEHKQQAVEDRRQRDRWRGSSTQRGYDYKHQQLRERVFKEQKYLCLRCLDAGRAKPCTDLHHKLRVTTHPHLRLERTNVVGCCRDCHEELEKSAE